MEIEWCETFRPTLKQVKRFFSRAIPIDSHLAVDDWYSPCYSEGTVIFKGGGEENGAFILVAQRR
jgi:hypothetical protein